MEICTYPDPILKKKAKEVVTFDKDIQELIDAMSAIMYQASGIGLAANQVGVAKRIILFDTMHREKGKNLNILINPTIVLAEDETMFEEGCLSVPEFTGEIARKQYLKVEGFDRYGKPLAMEAEGLTAICIQHEIDHLNGTLILDHVSSLKRNLYKRKVKKALKKEE